MSALKSVQLAIEHASLQRDELVKIVARIERGLTHAKGQMAQLEGYALDTDARWTASAARGLSAELVRHQYQFMDRLQHAIGMQAGVLANTQSQLAQAKSNLLRAEIRLSGLNQVLKVRQAVVVRKQQRREQRHTDEYAALQYTRNRARPMSGESHDY